MLSASKIRILLRNQYDRPMHAHALVHELAITITDGVSCTKSLSSVPQATTDGMRTAVLLGMQPGCLWTHEDPAATDHGRRSSIR